MERVAQRPVHVVASLRLRSECWMRFLQATSGFVATTRLEQGCLDYDLYVSVTRTGEIRTVERWASQTDADAHMAAPHTQAFLALAVDCAAEPPEITVLLARDETSPPTREATRSLSAAYV